MNHFPRK